MTYPEAIAACGTDFAWGCFWLALGFSLGCYDMSKRK